MPGSPATRTVEADWNDIPAALSRVSTAAAIAVEARQSQGSGQAGSSYTVSFRSIDGQPATAVIIAEEDWQPGGPPARLRISTTFSEPNEPARAAALADRLASALESLAGRSFAPIE